MCPVFLFIYFFRQYDSDAIWATQRRGHSVVGSLVCDLFHNNACPLLYDISEVFSNRPFFSDDRGILVDSKLLGTLSMRFTYLCFCCQQALWPLSALAIIDLCIYPVFLYFFLDIMIVMPSGQRSSRIAVSWNRSID